MYTICCVYLVGFPLLLSVDLSVSPADPRRWRWGVGGCYVRAVVGVA